MDNVKHERPNASVANTILGLPEPDAKAPQTFFQGEQSLLESLIGVHLSGWRPYHIDVWLAQE